MHPKSQYLTICFYSEVLIVEEKRLGIISLKYTTRNPHQRRSSEKFVESNLENVNEIIDNERSKGQYDYFHCSFFSI